MAGSGAFAARILDWCARHTLLPPRLTLLERSCAQLTVARQCLAAAVTYCYGDVVRMQDLETEWPLPSAHYDTVVIKSGLHELPLAVQAIAVASVARVLAPGGRFVNLDVLFDDDAERDEFAALVRWKDEQAGLHELATHRHFCTRREWYGMLADAGFTAITCARACAYRICSMTLGQTYWPGPVHAAVTRQWEGQVAQALALRAADRVCWQGTGSVLLIPAEITVAERGR
jgi:ubiquinone/menaquinone biosynthesis C-methylase UbiE